VDKIASEEMGIGAAVSGKRDRASEGPPIINFRFETRVNTDSHYIFRIRPIERASGTLDLFEDNAAQFPRARPRTSQLCVSPNSFRTASANGLTRLFNEFWRVSTVNWRA